MWRRGGVTGLWGWGRVIDCCRAHTTDMILPYNLPLYILHDGINGSKYYLKTMPTAANEVLSGYGLHSSILLD